MNKYGVNTYLKTEIIRNSIKKYNRSSYEKEICTWIDSLNVKFEHSYRKLIAPLLIDIYIPDYKLAIEFNGLYWHSELLKNKDYHLNKTLLCKEKGINLIHIWEDDWLNKKEIIQSIILNKLFKPKCKIFARKCKISELNNEDTLLFLNNNDLKGYNKFTNSYGLYYNDELVSLMSFNCNNIHEYKLVSFCNKLNTIVIGGASKLFRYFIKNNLKINEIKSYADISIFTGNIYNKLGFKYLNRSEINYWWIVKKIRKNVFDCDEEMMYKLGNYKIFGCGYNEYIWQRCTVN